MTIIKIVLYIVGIIVSLILIVISLLGINYLLIKKPKENKRGWRTRPLGRDGISYQEKGKNGWNGIEIDGEMLFGKISKVLYFKTKKKWNEYPEWAQNRREIINRIKLDFPPKDTEYEND